MNLKSQWFFYWVKNNQTCDWKNPKTQKQEVYFVLYFSEAQVFEIIIWTKKDFKVEAYLQWYGLNNKQYVTQSCI